jgi:hypothetical protein
VARRVSILRIPPRITRNIDSNPFLRDILPVFRKLGQMLMIVAVLSATGTHWLAFQSVAWTAMLAENLHTTSWQQAVKCTFDGKHPCCLCKEIARDKQSEKKSDIPLELKKLDYSYTNFEFVFCAPSEFYEVPPMDDIVKSVTRAPSVPPPKTVVG